MKFIRTLTIIVLSPILVPCSFLAYLLIESNPTSKGYISFFKGEF